jgi:hypothetical protein
MVAKFRNWSSAHVLQSLVTDEVTKRQQTTIDEWEDNIAIDAQAEKVESRAECENVLLHCKLEGYANANPKCCATFYISD